MNEYGWIKRRETLNRAKITEEMDEILWSLKVKELGEEALKKIEPIAEPSEEAKEENKQDESAQQQQEELYIPQAEYTAVCNADFLPMICNEFITEFLPKEHGACTIEQGEAIDLVRNFNAWIADYDLTCAKVTMYA